MSESPVGDGRGGRVLDRRRRLGLPGRGQDGAGRVERRRGGTGRIRPAHARSRCPRGRRTGCPAGDGPGAAAGSRPRGIEPIGVPSVRATVFSSSASTVTSAQAAAPAPAASGLLSASIVYTTSAAVTGSPSCHTASSRILNVQTLPLSSRGPRLGEVGLVRRPGAELHEPREHEPHERALRPVPCRDRRHRRRGADDALAVRDRGRRGRVRGGIGSRRLGGREGSRGRPRSRRGRGRAGRRPSGRGGSRVLGWGGGRRLSRRRRRPPARTAPRGPAGGW